MTCAMCRSGRCTCRCGTAHACGLCSPVGQPSAWDAPLPSVIPERQATGAERYAERERIWLLQRAIDAAVELSDLLATAKDAPSMVAECNRFLAMAGYVLHNDCCELCPACRIDAALRATQPRSPE